MESRKSMRFFIRSRDKRFPYVIPQIGELPTGLSKKDLANEDSFLAVCPLLFIPFIFFFFFFFFDILSSSLSGCLFTLRPIAS